MKANSAVMIRASAGTGKTFQLTNRLIQLLALGERPERILATTFTRKAAGEIQERLFRRLADGVLSQESARELGAFVEVSTLDSSKCAELFNQLVDSQHRLSICTLDSLFIKIANSFSYDLKLPSSLQILENVHERALLDEAIRQAIAKQPLGRIVELIRLLPKGDFTRRVHSKLESTVLSLLSLYFESPVEAWGFSELPESPSQKETNDALSDFAELELPKTKAGEPSKNWVNAQAASLRYFEEGDWENFLGKGFVKQVVTGEEKFARNEIPNQVRDVCQILVSFVRSEVLKRIHYETMAIYALVALVAERFEALKLESGRVGFGDVKRILASWEARDSLEHIYYRLDSKIGHILLDEFQDTSVDEWRVIEPLIDEIMSKASQEHSFFCVGDVKQAIYGWRGGVAEVFDEVEERYPLLEKAELNVSYRSSVEIVDFVNKVFGEIDNSEVLAKYPECANAWAEQFIPHETAIDDASGYVRVETTEFPGESEKAAHSVLRLAARRVKELAQEMPAASFGVLLRTNDSVRRMRFELGRGDDGIIASEEGGNPLTDSSAVEAFLSLFHLLDHPGDTIAQFHVSTSPLGKVLGLVEGSDEQSAIEQCLSKMRLEVQSNGLSSVLLDLVKQVAKECGERDRTRLEQLVELSYRFSPLQSSRLKEFVNYVRTTKVEYPVPAQVRVMTVHQAKGLEFDVVVLPELDGQLKGHFSEVIKSKPSALEPPERILRNVNQALRSLSSEVSGINQEENARQVKEALCFLYVALTRAKRGLYIFLAPRPEREQRPKLTYASILKEALGEVPDKSPSTCLFECGAESQLSFAVEKSALKDRSEIVKPTIKFNEMAATQRFLSPSKAGKEETREELLGSIASSALSRGRAVHLCFEHFSWVEDSLPDLRLLESRMKGLRVDEEIAADAVAVFERAVESQELAPCLSRRYYESSGCKEIRLYRELPFLVKLDDAFVRGCFDRLIVYERSDASRAVEVVDFKTGSKSSANDAGYQRQIAQYRQVAAVIFKTSLENVSASLAYVDELTLVKPFD